MYKPIGGKRYDYPCPWPDSQLHPHSPDLEPFEPAQPASKTTSTMCLILCNPPAKPLAPGTFGLIQDRISVVLSKTIQCRPAPRSQPGPLGGLLVNDRTATYPNYHCLAHNRILQNERPAYSHFQLLLMLLGLARILVVGSFLIPSPRLLALHGPSHSHNQFGIPCQCALANHISHITYPASILRSRTSFGTEVALGFGGFGLTGIVIYSSGFSRGPFLSIPGM